MRSAGLIAAATLLLAGCAPSLPPPATPRPTPLPTRQVRVTPTVVPLPPTATPLPNPTPANSGPLSARDFDPFRDWYATERDGLWVTTRNPRGRYYYRWDDRRWYAIEDRVWFRELEDLLTVYPGRQPAP